MPNHCSQDLFVYGPEPLIKEFISFAEDTNTVLSHEKFVPYPKQYKDLDEAAAIARKSNPTSMVKDGFNSGGYEWCLENWGTKWGIYRAELTKSKLKGKRSQVNYTFDSAWSPAIPVIRAMSIRFPELTFKLKYYEMGAAYKGVYEVVNGIVLKDDESTYKGSRGG